MKLLDGIAVCIFANRSYLGDSFHTALALLSSSAFAARHIAALLRGSVFLSGAGNSFLSLEPVVTASFTSLSASSLPFTPSCPGTQRKVSLIPGCCFLAKAHQSWNMSHTYCASAAIVNADLSRVATLSAAMVALLTLCSLRR